MKDFPGHVVSIIALLKNTVYFIVMDTLQQPHIRTAGIIVLTALALYLGASAVSEMKSWKFIGSGTTATNTISVSGKGEVFAVPDIATFTLTISETAKDVQSAQKTATQKANDIIAYLRGEGNIAEKDIKTINYSVQPKYEWIQATCYPSRPCPPGENKLVGYTVEQSLEVKVRDTDKAGEVLAAAGSRGVSQVSGLEFKVDDEDALKVEARKKAIIEAQEKASSLARDLGVTIVRVVGFNEDAGYQPPMYYRAEKAVMMSADMAGAAPEMPVGENKVQSNVTVTYEIR